MAKFKFFDLGEGVVVRLDTESKTLCEVMASLDGISYHYREVPETDFGKFSVGGMGVK